MYKTNVFFACQGNLLLGPEFWKHWSQVGMQSDSMTLSAKIETCIKCSNRITMAWESVKTLEGKEQFSSLGGNSTEINGNIQRYPKAARDWNRQDQIWLRKWPFMTCLTWKWKLSVACPLFHFCFFLTLQVLKNTHVKLDMGEFSGWKKEQTIQQFYFNLKFDIYSLRERSRKTKAAPQSSMMSPSYLSFTRQHPFAAAMMYSGYSQVQEISPGGLGGKSQAPRAMSL